MKHNYCDQMVFNDYEFQWTTSYKRKCQLFIKGVDMFI